MKKRKGRFKMDRIYAERRWLGVTKSGRTPMVIVYHLGIWCYPRSKDMLKNMALGLYGFSSRFACFGHD